MLSFHIFLWSFCNFNMVPLIIQKKTFFPSCSAIRTLESRRHGRKQTKKSIVPGLIMSVLGYRCVLFFSLFYSILLVNVHSSRLKNITVYFKQIYTHLVQCLSNTVNFFIFFNPSFLHTVAKLSRKCSHSDGFIWNFSNGKYLIKTFSNWISKTIWCWRTWLDSSKIRKKYEVQI